MEENKGEFMLVPSLFVMLCRMQETCHNVNTSTVMRHPCSLRGGNPCVPKRPISSTDFSIQIRYLYNTATTTAFDTVLGIQIRAPYTSPVTLDI